MPGPIYNQFPGGCYLTFNWSLDRPSSARLVELVSNAHVEGYQEINLLLSSIGGALMDTHYAIEALAALPVKLVTWNISAIQSAANMLFAVGVERYAVPGSGFYFHQTGFEGSSGQRSSEKEVREQLRLIELGDERSATFISERTGIAADVVAGWQRDITTVSAADAVPIGLAHAVRRPTIPKDAFVKQIPAS